MTMHWYAGFKLAASNNYSNNRELKTKSITSVSPQQVGAGKSPLWLLCRFPNSITTTWQHTLHAFPRNFPVDGLMDFGHYWTQNKIFLIYQIKRSIALRCVLFPLHSAFTSRTP